MNKPVIGALILAAGQGRRFGRDKRFLAVGEGKTLLDTVVERSVDALTHCVVVVDDRQTQTRYAAEGIPAVICDEACLGMGHSLARGAR